MFIYNVTTKVDAAIHEVWLSWMQQEHIPDVIATGCFAKAQLLRLLEVDESDGPTYAIQYFAESKALYNRYMEKHAATLRQKVSDKWGSSVIAFRSLMQVVN
ncbi:MAG TPA: DUF4286 family protein [Ferruginibacter sp.]|nr:DUF4286 family protein [Ferruginibacter sp.]HMP19740.1 DUF4286 family protein [Ferruginibacter sp.]